MIRSPVEVVASLVKAEGIDVQTALDLWIGSVLRSERMSRQHPRRLVRYDQLIVILDLCWIPAAPCGACRCRCECQLCVGIC